MRRNFNQEYKQEVVKIVRESGKSAHRVAKELGLQPGCVRAWVVQQRIDEGQGPVGALTSDEKEELRRLRKECQVLKMERDILKKAAAFFAKESR
jgi:transposase